MASYDKTLAIEPNHVEAFENRGIALHSLKRLKEALASYDRALEINPDRATTLYNRAKTLEDMKRFGEALTNYNRALVIKPDFAEALNNCGNILRSLKQPKEALKSYNRALAIRPGYAEALNNRGVTLVDLKHFGAALQSFERALAVKPDYAEALYNRGVALDGLKRYGEALASYNGALAIKPDYAEALNNRGNTLENMKRFEEALMNYDKALVIKPDYAEALYNRGVMLGVLGKFDEARTAYRQSLALDPSASKVYLGYADLVTFSVNDPHIKKMEAMRDGSVPLSDTDRIHLDFALAKAYADLKDYGRSFRSVLNGNALKRAQIHYDESEEMAYFDRIEAVFTSGLIRQKAMLRGNPSHTPIFIFGMPRSGSTLVEQILASHPEVHGAGELTILSAVASEIRGPESQLIPYPEFAAGRNAQVFRQVGAHYLTEIRKLAPAAKRITDKMPSNYYFAGLIYLALPGAYVIHTIRDPLDNCVSCFSKLFTDGQNHTFDLAELGRYYRRYQKMMAHWRRILPQGHILEVRYEDVVADLEGQARRIIAHCGLEWNARCISFHATDRPVRTASSSQVRQPVYRSAIGRAQAYGGFLDPLKNALEGTDAKNNN